MATIKLTLAETATLPEAEVETIGAANAAGASEARARTRVGREANMVDVVE